MKFIILIALIAISVYARNPGAIIGLKGPILDKIKDQYFDLIMIGLNFIFIENIKQGTVTLTNIQPDIDIPNSSHVTLGFDEPNNSLIVTVVGAGLKVHLNWQDTASRKTGVADLTGTVASITMMMSFDSEVINDTHYPKINFDSVRIRENIADFTIEHGCNNCDSDTINRIQNTIGVQLFNHFESEAKGIVNTLIANVVNLQLQSLYPSTFPISGDISVALGNTGKIMVTESFVAVPIDATIYNPSSGFERCMEAPEFSIQNVTNPGDMLLFSSDYVFKCMTNIMNKYDIKFTFPVFGTNVTIDIDGDLVPFELESEVGHMRMIAGGRISIPSVNIALTFAVDTKMDLDIFRGDIAAMFYITPKLIDADFSTLILSVWGFNIDLKNSIVPFINQLMVSIINLIVLPRITVPYIESVPVRLVDANLEFFANHTEAGITVGFN
jgi:hypothetical protein